MTELLFEGRWTRVCSVRTVSATEGAIVDAIDMVRVLSVIVEVVEDTTLVVLVCAPGTAWLLGGYADP